MTKKKHTCVERINGLLAEHNTKLAECFTLDGSRELIQLTTTKANAAARGPKPKVMFASYCPFCGVKLKGAV